MQPTSGAGYGFGEPWGGGYGSGYGGGHGEGVGFGSSSGEYCGNGVGDGAYFGTRNGNGGGCGRGNGYGDGDGIGVCEPTPSCFICCLDGGSLEAQVLHAAVTTRIVFVARFREGRTRDAT